MLLEKEVDPFFYTDVEFCLFKCFLTSKKSLRLLLLLQLDLRPLQQTHRLDAHSHPIMELMMDIMDKSQQMAKGSMLTVYLLLIGLFHLEPA